MRQTKLSRRKSWAVCDDYPLVRLFRWEKGLFNPKGDEMRNFPILIRIYLVVLLLAYLFGVVENRVDTEGMGFLPLLLLTTPWSWPLLYLAGSPIFGGGLHGFHVGIFVTCNIISGTANSYILYLWIRWRQKEGRHPKSR